MRAIYYKRISQFSLLFLLFFLSFYNAYSQNEWITISPENEFFSFQMPGEPQSQIENPEAGMSFYTYVVDSSFAMQYMFLKKDSSFEYYLNNALHPQDSAAIGEDSITIDMFPDSMLNPLMYLNNIWSSLFDSTNVFLDSNFTMYDSTIFGKDFEMQIFYPNDFSEYIYSRSFYNGHDILTFSVRGPANLHEELVAYKNEYFNSIVISP